MPLKKRNVIRYVYLYLVTAITIVLILISTIGLVQIFLEEIVFDVKGWEEEMDVEWQCDNDGSLKPIREIETEVDSEKVEVSETREECIERVSANQKSSHANNVKRHLVNWISMLIVALPLYFYHWGIIKKESKK